MNKTLVGTDKIMFLLVKTMLFRNFGSSTKLGVAYIHSTSVVNTRPWRRSKDLPDNKTIEGPLTDLPDYTYSDGRPTPLMSKQAKRMLIQRLYAAEIVKLSGELKFAIERHARKIEAEDKMRKNIVENRLKPKGPALLKTR